MSRTTKKIYNSMDMIEIILNEYPETKDNDKLLISKMWEVELLNQNLDPKTTPIDMFFSLYERNVLSNADTILRARRKLQEQNEHLRGENWYKRHRESDHTRMDINNI
jgi:hypothetical protein